MICPVFQQWYEHTFIPAGKKRQEVDGIRGKVILVLDNCPAHPPAELLNKINPNFEVKFRKISVHYVPNIYTYCGFIRFIFVFKVRYVPPNVTSIFQPMDQGAIELKKRAYRQQLLRYLMFVSSEEEFMALFKGIDILKACKWLALLATAWAHGPQCLRMRCGMLRMESSNTVPSAHLDETGALGDNEIIMAQLGSLAPRRQVANWGQRVDSFDRGFA